jgi:RNA polymerase sigma factor (sigma-70 family)
VNDHDNRALVSDYVKTGSEAAFRELVARYLGLVYSTALRLVGGDTHWAEDVTQTVFSDLARKARGLSKSVSLGGWLYQRTFNVAAPMMRAARRRQSREREVAQMNALHDDSCRDLARIEPILDETIMELSPEDRTAITLRFFERRDYKFIGNALGSNDDAARMRVSRALDKLHGLLMRRGVQLSAAGLGTALTCEAVTAAPIGLAASVATIALSKSAGAGVAGISLKVLLTMTKAKAIGIAIVAILGTSVLMQLHMQEQLRETRSTVQRQNASTAVLEADNDRLSKLASGKNDSESSSPAQLTEVMRLRAEVSRLRTEASERAKVNPGSTSTASSKAEAMLDRVGLLRARLEETPAAKIPEFQFLTPEDWLLAADRKLDTDADYQKGFSDLRNRAEGRFLTLMQPALFKYIQTHGEQFPPAVEALKPYFDSPPTDEMLRRYHVVPGSSVPHPNLDSDWVIAVQSTLDPESNNQMVLGRKGQSGSALEMDTATILAPAMKALMDNTPEVGGKRSVDIRELGPYLKTTEEKAAFQKLLGANPKESK